MNLPLAVILAYTAVILGMGFVLSRRVRRSGDFFVAGRALGPGLLCSTLLAANIGAGSTVGAAGLGYRDGLAAWWWVGAAALGSFVLAFWVGPRIWRIATREGFHTVGDYLEHRFDRRARPLSPASSRVGGGEAFSGPPGPPSAAAMRPWMAASRLTVVVSRGALLSSPWSSS